MRQILLNPMSNARFTQKGEVVIPTLFDAIAQADSTTTRECGGTGREETIHIISVRQEWQASDDHLAPHQPQRQG